MVHLQRIMVALDFSPHADIALNYGVELAKAFQAEIIVCHVIEQPDLLSQLPPGGEAYFPPNLHEVHRKQAAQECREMLKEKGVANGRAVIGEGTPFVEILRIADSESVDLLIVGTHGRGAIAHMLLGSVAERVVRKARCPVLTVHRGEHEFVMP